MALIVIKAQRQMICDTQHLQWHTIIKDFSLCGVLLGIAPVAMYDTVGMVLPEHQG